MKALNLPDVDILYKIRIPFLVLVLKRLLSREEDSSVREVIQMTIDCLEDRRAGREELWRAREAARSELRKKASWSALAAQAAATSLQPDSSWIGWTILAAAHAAKDPEAEYSYLTEQLDALAKPFSKGDL